MYNHVRCLYVIKTFNIGDKVRQYHGRRIIHKNQMKYREANDNNSIKTFDCFGDPETFGLRWKLWLSGFEWCADRKGLIIAGDNTTVKQRKRALLLHLAGSDVKRIFSTLTGTGDVKHYA